MSKNTDRTSSAKGSDDAGTLFDFTIDMRGNVITVRNCVLTNADSEAVCKHIDQINAPPDPYVLYIQRLERLLEDKGQTRTQLGLYSPI